MEPINETYDLTRIILTGPNKNKFNKIKKEWEDIDEILSKYAVTKPKERTIQRLSSKMIREEKKYILSEGIGVIVRKELIKEGKFKSPYGITYLDIRRNGVCSDYFYARMPDVINNIIKKYDGKISNSS